MSVNPLHLFLCAIALSAFTAVGRLLLSKEEVTLRSLLGVVLFHGELGGASGMFVYEFYALRESPWAVIVIAIFYGAGVIEINYLGLLVKEMLKGMLKSLTKTTSDEPNK